jgi:hypothetical protein
MAVLATDPWIIVSRQLPGPVDTELDSCDHGAMNAARAKSLLLGFQIRKSRNSRPSQISTGLLRFSPQKLAVLSFNRNTAFSFWRKEIYMEVNKSFDGMKLIEHQI